LLLIFFTIMASYDFKKKPESELRKLKKDEVIDYVLKLHKFNDNLQAELLKKIEETNNEVKKLTDLVRKVIDENNKLRASVSVSEKVSTELRRHLDYLEAEVQRSNQYSRRECIELSGIRVTVNDESLEKVCIDILSKIDVRVDSGDIHACHRLKKGQTILKFVNRKNAELALANRTKLKNQNLSSIGIPVDVQIYINQNTNPYYKFLRYQCKLLHDRNLINKFWSFNGGMKIQVVENGSVSVISHMSKLTDIFPNFEFKKYNL